MKEFQSWKQKLTNMLNIRETEEQKIYVSSDFHLGHQRDFVWQARGYNSAAEHDAGLIKSVNDTVRPSDVLLFLGDFCLNTTLDQYNSYLDKIQCQNIYMLWGNHNNPHEKNVYRKIVGTEVEVYPTKYKNVTYYGHYLEAILGGQFTVLCHYPLYIWNEMQHGAWMLCGHSHYGCPLTKADNLYGKILDVGWDGHGKPWSLEEIALVMNDKRFVSLDHHTNE
jgi:calcineurin-like phosphoesterase family protein